MASKIIEIILKVVFNTGSVLLDPISQSLQKFGDKIVSTHFQPLKILDYIKNRQRSFELNKLAMNLRGTQRRPVKIASLGNFDPLKDSPFKIGNGTRDLTGKGLDMLSSVKANDIKTMFDGTLVKITRTQRDHPQEGLKFCNFIEGSDYFLDCQTVTLKP